MAQTGLVPGGSAHTCTRAPDIPIQSSRPSPTRRPRSATECLFVVNPVTPQAAAPQPEASIRATVLLPIRLADGSEALALAYSFHGLADGRDVIGLTLGDV